ncbi:nuclear transport factor 2 family protein [Pedobacter gandavensis]|uniref:YybH family protein n=1 Tax=Pedobacter gandavensis TaxID=2679963 RepID=UPI00292F0903|nr:nuclear transport factor 2 family protein [Pedobacter gandavensis]
MSSVSFFKRQEEEAIRLSRMDSNMSISNQDVAGVAKYWMDDIIVISGEGGQYSGKAKLLKTWKEMFAKKPPLFERIPSSIVIGDSGILAWETGTWNYKTEPFRGNYSAMWRKINGVWLTQSELFVSLD